METVDTLPLEIVDPLVKLDISTDKESIKSDATDEQSTNVTLQQIPVELLLKIFSYLEAKFLYCTIALVSRYFNLLINDDNTWKIRIAQKFPGKKYPPLLVSDDFNWRIACAKREDQRRLWTTGRMNHFSLSGGHYSSVDAVHLMNKGEICVSGSRDRQLSLWNLTLLDLDDQPNSVLRAKTTCITTAHDGWIWSITSHEHSICTGSWDTYVKLWDMASDMKETMKIKGKSAILCTALRQDILATGSYDKWTILYDPRSGYSPVKQMAYHAKPVLCIAVDDDYVITGSEDSRVAIHDRRADKQLDSVLLPTYVMSMSYKLGHLWIGDRKGFVHLIQPKTFKHFKTYDVGHKNKITGIQFSMGSLITCSADRTIRISEPTDNPRTIHTITSGHFISEISSIDFQNDVLASGEGDAAVDVWIPADR